MATTQVVNEYEKQADDFLSRHNLIFAAALVGSDCPKFCGDAQAGRKMDEVNKFPRKSHIHGKHYRCAVRRNENDLPYPNAQRSVVFDFWNSYADEEYNTLGGTKYRNGEKMLRYSETLGKRKGVRAYDLLACIEKSDPGTFEDFCSNFGYDTDSRKAFDIYIAVQDEAQKVQRFFTAEELAELREIS